MALYVARCSPRYSATENSLGGALCVTRCRPVPTRRPRRCASNFALIIALYVTRCSLRHALSMAPDVTRCSPRHCASKHARTPAALAADAMLLGVLPITKPTHSLSVAKTIIAALQFMLDLSV